MKVRNLAAALTAALLFGCNGHGSGGDSDAPSAPGAQVLFLDDFSGGFPGPNWIVMEGFPFADEERGNSPPGLVLGLFNRARARGAFEFSTADPVTVSFELSTPGVLTESNTRFALTIKRAEFPTGEASIEVRNKDGVLRFEILGSDAEFDFFTDAGFHKIEFTVELGVATWKIDGQPHMTMAGFPEGLYSIEVEGNPGQTLGFVLDNVIVTTP